MVTVWRVQALTAVGAMAASLAVVGLAARGSTAGAVLWIAALVVLVIGGILGVVLPRVAWERWSYDVAPRALELRHGILTHRRSVVPYYRVQHIDIRSGPVERALGMAQLVVRTAAATTDAHLPGIPADESDRLRGLILERAGRGDAV